MLYAKSFHFNTEAHKLHHIHVLDLMVGIVSQLAHKHYIGIGLKNSLMGFLL